MSTSGGISSGGGGGGGGGSGSALGYGVVPGGGSIITLHSYGPEVPEPPDAKIAMIMFFYEPHLLDWENEPYSSVWPQVTLLSGPPGSEAWGSNGKYFGLDCSAGFISPVQTGDGLGYASLSLYGRWSRWLEEWYAPPAGDYLFQIASPPGGSYEIIVCNYGVQERSYPT